MKTPRMKRRAQICKFCGISLQGTQPIKPFSEIYLRLCSARDGDMCERQQARHATSPIDKPATRKPAKLTPRAATRAMRDHAFLWDAVARVSFEHAAIPTICNVQDDGFHLTLTDTPHRDTGEMIAIDLRWDFPRNLMSIDQAVAWIYSCAREAWVHELNEALHVDGVRRRDLHDAQGRTILPPEETPWLEPLP